MSARIQKEHLYALLGIAILLGIWEITSLIAGGFIVPSPLTTIGCAFSKLTEGLTWKQISITLFRVLIGFAIAFISGIVTGIIIGGNRDLEHILRPTIVLFQGMPPILWAIPLILIFGTGNLSPILVISLICFPLVTLNIAEGTKTEPLELQEMLKIYAPSRKARLRELTIPHLRPFILSSLKIGIVLGIKASVVAEFFGSNDGIGFQIEAAYQSFEVKNLFAWGIILILLIIILDWSLSKLGIINRLVTLEVIKIQNRKCHSASLTLTKKNLYSAIKTINTSPQQAEKMTIVLRSVSFSYPPDMLSSTDKNSINPKASPTYSFADLKKQNTRKYEFDSISQTISQTRKVLTNINLEVKSNEIAVITGDSGIGKTTLLKLIAGIYTPDSGEIKAPKNIGFVFQEDRLLPWQTVIKNVALPLLYSEKSSPIPPLCFASFLLGEVGLQNDAFKFPSQLSGGMKKRAALARCFARLPEVILMDEPFTGLHREARFDLWEKLFTLLKTRELPVVIVTHFPEDIPKPEMCTFYELSGKPASLISMK